MKILRILNRLNVGGPTYNAANLSKYLGSEFETKLLSAKKELDEASSEYLLEQMELPYTLVPNMHRAINPKKDFKAYQFIAKEMELYKPNIVHTHAAKAGALGRLAAIFSKHKPLLIIHTYHGNVFDGYFSPLKTMIILFIERWLAKYSTAIVSISETQKKDLVEKYKIAPANKIHVIPLGFDLTKFTEDGTVKRKQFRDELGIPENTLLISITGRLAPVKNHALFIDAIALLKKQSNIPFVAVVVGDGELRNELEDLARKKDLKVRRSDRQEVRTYDDPTIRRSDVIFTSWRKDIDYVNAGSDIVALTSINEGTPVSIIEAMAAGKAVVSTNVGGVADVITHNETGLLTDQDPQQFANALQRLMETESLRIKLSTNAKVAVTTKYSYKRLVNDMEALYNKLLTPQSRF